MRLKRQYFNVKDVIWDDSTRFDNGILRINKREIYDLIKPLVKNVTNIDFEIVKPGENKRIVHVLDTIQPMFKVEGKESTYAGFLGRPLTTGDGVTNLLSGFTVMESAPLPWESTSASSGLLYPRDAIIDMVGPIAGYSPFSETINLVITYELVDGKSSAEYDNDIRICGLTISDYLAKTTKDICPNFVREYTIEDVNPELPNVVLVWQCQNQGTYSNTFLYGHSIDNLVPTLLHPNEMLDGCVVSGNYVWPAFKVPTYLHVNHPILLELYKRHGKDLNFRGVIFSRSHNPTHWHKERSATFCRKLAKYLDADGLIMAWEGGGNAAVDGMLTIKESENTGIRCSTMTFEFGGKDGTEGDLLMDHVPEADAIISGGSLEQDITLPEVEYVVGGDVMRLNKESGGYFPPAKGSITFDTHTHIYCAGNQSGHGKLYAAAY
jgi:sarcosine reductase